MSRKMLLVAFIATTFTSSIAFGQEKPAEDPLDKHLNFFFGQKMLDDKDWNKEFKAAGLPNLASQTSFGIEGTYGSGKWPVQIATDFLYSQASGKSTALNRTVTGSTFELGVGARKI